MSDKNKESELTPEAKELLRKYIFKLVTPVGIAASILGFVIGFVINEVARSQAYGEAYNEAIILIQDKVITEIEKLASKNAELEQNLKRSKLLLAESQQVLDNTGELTKKVAEEVSSSREVKRIISSELGWAPVNSSPKSFDPSCEYRWIIKDLNGNSNAHEKVGDYIYATQVASKLLSTSFTPFGTTNSNRTVKVDDVSIQLGQTNKIEIQLFKRCIN